MKIMMKNLILMAMLVSVSMAGKGSPAVVDATGAEVAVADPNGLVKKGADGVGTKGLCLFFDGESDVQEPAETLVDPSNWFSEPTADEVSTGGLSSETWSATSKGSPIPLGEVAWFENNKLNVHVDFSDAAQQSLVFTPPATYDGEQVFTASLNFLAAYDSVDDLPKIGSSKAGIALLKNEDGGVCFAFISKLYSIRAWAVSAPLSRANVAEPIEVRVTRKSDGVLVYEYKDSFGYVQTGTGGTVSEKITSSRFCGSGVINSFDGKISGVAQQAIGKAFDIANTWTTVEEVYDLDGNFAGYKVILGQDYGPLVLPKDIGAVTIDLNGWTIKGTDGADGTTTTAGGAGGAAITVAGVCGASEGATAITVMNDAGASGKRPAPGTAAGIVGGNGGDGNPAGKGSPAVVEATGAEVAVADPNGLVKKGADGHTFLPNVPYRAWNETTRQMEDGVCTNYTIVTEETTTFDDDQWYVVTGVVSRGTIAVSGEAHLILCDGAKLTCDGEKPNVYHCFEPGILLNDPHTLCVYGQAEGTGTLEALGALDCAGIGSGTGDSPTAGGLTVNGGVVLATGQDFGAGIGGSNTSFWKDYGNGGTVTVNGGQVTAIGGGYAAGIGGGAQGRGGVVTIRGGTVVSQGGQGGFGHGHGVSDSGTLTIDGGSVKAQTAAGLAKNSATKNVYCVTAKVEGLRVEGLNVEGLGDYGTNDIFAIDGKVYLYLPNGIHTFTIDGLKYRAVVEDAATTAAVYPELAPGEMYLCDTAEEATNALGRAELKPSDMVAAALGSDEARTTYRNMFFLDIVPTSDDKWAVAALLKPEGWTNVVLSATAATRQIPVAGIAALADDATTNVTLVGCEPGFYYTLHDGAVLTGIVPDADAANRDVLCGADGEVVFPAVGKPSDAMGFFRVGVDATTEDAK